MDGSSLVSFYLRYLKSNNELKEFIKNAPYEKLNEYLYSILKTMVNCEIIDSDVVETIKFLVVGLQDRRHETHPLERYSSVKKNNIIFEANTKKLAKLVKKHNFNEELIIFTLRIAIIEGNIHKLNFIYNSYPDIPHYDCKYYLLDAIRTKNRQIIDWALMVTSVCMIKPIFIEYSVNGDKDILLIISRYIANHLDNFPPFRLMVHNLNYNIWMELVKRIYSTNHKTRSVLIEKENLIAEYPALNIDILFENASNEVKNNIDLAIEYLEQLVANKYAPGSRLFNEAEIRFNNKLYG
jgi:hypothetical protein